MGWLSNIGEFLSNAVSGPTRAVNSPNNPNAVQESLDKFNLDKLRNAQGEYEPIQQAAKPFVGPMQPTQESSGYMDQIGKYLGGSNGLVKQAGTFLGSDTGRALGGMGLQIGSSILGSNAAQKDYDQSMESQRQAADLAGAYSALGPAEAAAVKDNENMVALRAQALQGLQQRAQTGITPEDQAELNQLRNQTNAQFQSRQATIQQDMGRRGMQNSGLALASQMGNNQALTQQQSNSADNQAAMAFKAKQDALSSLADRSSNALQSDFNRDIDRAKNADAVSRFNTTNQMNSAQNKANAVQSIAQTQAQAGQRKADLYTGVGNAAAGVVGTKKPKVIV